LLFTSLPSCHLGPVPASTAPSFHSIHQQAPLNSILQQAPLNSVLQHAPLNSIHQQAQLSSIHQQATLNPILQQAPLPSIHQPVPPNLIHQQVPLTPVYQQGLVTPILQQPHLNPVPHQAFGITQSSGLPLPSSAAAIHPLLGLQQAGLREASGMLGYVPPLAEAFVVGPGFLPIPYKLVVAITSGQFVDFSSLLVKPSEPLPSGPVISIDGRVVVSHNPKPLRRLHDIAQWVQAFSIYTLVMVSYCPWRAVDLLKYQLLILRTQAQFGGQAWLNSMKLFGATQLLAMCLTGPACTLNFIISILPLPGFRLPPPPACFLRARELVSPPVFAVPGMLDVASVLALFAAIFTFVTPHAVVVRIGVFTALTFPLVNRLRRLLGVCKGPRLARVNLYIWLLLLYHSI
jgi:hypothetical protein